MMRRRLILALTAFAALGLAVVALMLSRHPAAPAVARAPESALGAFIVPAVPAGREKALRPEIIEALGLGAVSSPWNRRLDLIRKQSADLTAVEAEALLAALMEQCPPTVSAAIHSTYMHEIACILQLRGDIRERFARALATLARDPARDEATRDYAIQHLRQVWSRAAGDPALRSAIVATFREFTRLDPVLATPALLSLHLLGSPAGESSTRSGPRAGAQSAATVFSLPDSDLAPLLQPIFAAKTSTQNMPARLTAMRIVGERRLTAFRQSLLTALRDRSEHALVRMAAANALGKIADPADLATLASLDPGDARVAAALRHALRPAANR